MEQPRPFAPRTERVVGRVFELDEIRSALCDSTEISHILYFVGPGGIGKTRLLEEAALLATEIEGSAIAVADIVDLYHSEFHSAEGIQAAIADGLDPEGLHFLAFRDKRRWLAQSRAAGVDPSLLITALQELDELFLADYDSFSRDHRSLLRLDTTELIQYESERVQQVCQIEQVAAEVQTWLLRTLPQLPNTVTLLAGRPPAPLRDELQACSEKAEGSVFRASDLEGLTLPDSLEYLRELAKTEPRLRSIPDDMRRRIWEYTDGHPIRLSLLIDLALNGQDIAELFPPLRDGSTQIEKEQIDAYLMREIMRLSSPNRELLHYLALARKGLDAGLLQHLTADVWSEEECQNYLEGLRRFTFVKSRPDTDLLFMHDALYEIFDRFIRGQRQEYEGSYRAIAKYYEQQAEGKKPAEERALRPARLYYELQVDPRASFWNFYVKWAEEAVRAFDLDLDMRLRDELLRYLRESRDDRWVSWRLPREVIDRDAAVRWVRRYLSQGKHREAAEVARRIRESDDPVFRSADPLYVSALQTASAEALIYTGADEDQVLALLAEAIEALEHWTHEDEDDPRVWWQARVLGRAYNNRGYIYWQQGRNEVAIREFRKALWRFRQADIRDEMADTLTNLGFVYARWGRTTDAESMLQDAIALRTEFGLEFARGLSLNALGLTYVYDGFPLRGEKRCRQALDIFERLQQPRGIGLAHTALGLALRKQGDQWKEGTYTQEEAQCHFEEAVKHLEQAEQVFSEIEEPLRLWEIYNGWGSVYCDWGWLLLQQGRNEEAQEKYDLGVKYQEKSIEIAEKHGFNLLAVDSYDDLAQIYADRGAPSEQYEKWLDKVRKLTPPEYQISPGGFRDVPDPIEGWWLALGKIHLGYGVRAMKVAIQHGVASDEKDRLLDEATDHYALAIAYYQRYSPKAHELNTTFKSIHRRLKTVRADRLQRLRERIADFGETYKVDMSRLLEPLDATLGLEPPSKLGAL